jgi:hypothetical protein
MVLLLVVGGAACAAVTKKEQGLFHARSGAFFLGPSVTPA